MILKEEEMSVFSQFPYEAQIQRHMLNIPAGIYDNLKNIDCYPNSISHSTLKMLVEYACKGQNIAPIEIARKKIGEMNHNWLADNIQAVASDAQVLSRAENIAKSDK